MRSAHVSLACAAQVEYDAAALRTLQRARVVGMTTSWAAKSRELIAVLGSKVTLLGQRVGG
jgi:hypothetical protein